MPSGRNLRARVVGIVTHPAGEWPVIAGERADARSLVLAYAAPLVGTYRVGMARGLLGAIVSWAFALVGIYLAALIVEKLAPTFKSSGGLVPALKLVVYASTPVWIVGVLNLVPVFVPLTLLAALYGAYLFSIGLPSVVHTPSNQVIPYMFVATLVSIVVFLALGLAAGAIAGAGGYSGI